MTYLQFHLVFLLPPLTLLGWSAWRRRALLPRRAGPFLGLMALIALVYTTPWDNYLVWRGVWGYGGGRVLGTIGYVPVEEYLFFVLQPLLAGLWLYRLLGGGEGGGRREEGGTARWVGAVLYLGLAGAGFWLLAFPTGTYLGLILAWAAPVLAAQWGWAGAEIWRRRSVFLAAVAVPTLYLWVADAIAIGIGIWHISPDLSTGAIVLGLPVEEAVFFLVTNLLVVQGLMLFLYPPGRTSTPVVGQRSSVVGRPMAPDRRRTTDDR